MRLNRALVVAFASASLLLIQGPPTLAANYVEGGEVGNSGWWDAAFRQVVGVERFWDFGAPATANKGADPLYVVLGFGDSFGSGEGAWDGPGTEWGTRSESTRQDLMYHGGTFANHIYRGCHISTKSSFYLNVEHLRKKYGKDIVGANFACTGAESMHIVGSNLEACRDQIVNSDWRIRGRQIGGARGAEGKRGLCSALPGGSRAPGSGFGFTVETDAKWAKSNNPLVQTTNPDDWQECLSVRYEWQMDCLVGIQGIRSPGADYKEFFNYLIGEGTGDLYPNDQYQSQLFYADKWLKALRSASNRPVVVTGAYVSVGGNDKGFGPAMKLALAPNIVSSWGALYTGVNSFSVRDSLDWDDRDDYRQIRNLMDQPSITYQLEATYRLLEKYMRDWNDAQFISGYTWPVGEVVDPFIAVQEYPDNAVAECDSSGTSWMDNIASAEATWLDRYLTQPLLRDIRLAVSRLRADGMRIGAVPLDFAGHGPCVGEDVFDSRRWINTPEDAIAAGQNDSPADVFGVHGLIPMSKASIHPNERGHRAIFENMQPMVEGMVDGSVNAVRNAAVTPSFNFNDSCLKTSNSMSGTDLQTLSDRYNRGETFVGKVYIGQKHLWTRYEPHSDKDQWSADKAIKMAVDANHTLASGLPVGPSEWPDFRRDSWADLLVTPNLVANRSVQTVAAGVDYGHVSATKFGERLPASSEDSGFVRQERLRPSPPITSKWGNQVRDAATSAAIQPTGFGQLEVTVLADCWNPDYAVVTIKQQGGPFLKSRGVPIGGVPWDWPESDSEISADYLWVLATGTPSDKGTQKAYPDVRDQQVSAWPRLIPWSEARVGNISASTPALTLENDIDDVWWSRGPREGGFRLCDAQPDYSRLLRGPYTLALTMKNGREAAEATATGVNYVQPWGPGEGETDTLRGARIFHTQPSLSCIEPATAAIPQYEQAWAMRCEIQSFNRTGTFNPCRVEVLFKRRG